MSSFSPIIEKIKESQSYSEKARILTFILNSFQGKRVDLEDKKELSDFAFSEISKLITLIPSLESYKEKDDVFSYEDSILGVVMLCYSSPAEIVEDKLNDIRTLQEIVNKERFIENAIDDIFGQGNNSKDNIERLLCMLVPLKDNYQRGQLFNGLVHYRAKIAELPEDSMALLSDYIASEIKRCLSAELDDEVIGELELACDVCKHFINETIIELLNEALKLGKANINFYAVSTLLEAGQTVSVEVIRNLANDIEYAELTYGTLQQHGLTELFPEELRTPEYLAKSNMVRWLVYPTELGKYPDRIELLGKVKKKEEYYIFRFSSDSENLGDELKGKWLIGWASDEGGTFSNFDLYESFEKKTVEKTLKFIKKKLL